MLTFFLMVAGLLIAAALLFVAFAFGTRNRGKQNVHPVAKDPNTARPMDPSPARAIGREN